MQLMIIFKNSFIHILLWNETFLISYLIFLNFLKYIICQYLPGIGVTDENVRPDLKQPSYNISSIDVLFLSLWNNFEMDEICLMEHENILQQ